MKKRTDRPNVTNINFFCGNSVTIDSSAFKWVAFLLIFCVLLKTLVISDFSPDVCANIIRSLISIAEGM
jgi:hypothetical protein